MSKSSVTFVSTVKDLRVNLHYCDPELAASAVADFPLKPIPHCLSLRLMHFYGPYKNQELKCDVLVLVAKCVHDEERNVLVSVQLGPDFPLKITFNHINATFTLKNFATIKCSKTMSFAMSDLDCHIVPNPFYEVAIIVAKKYNSVLQFYNENDSSSTLEEEMDAEQLDLQTNPESSTESDTTITDQNDLRFEEDNFLTDDENELISMFNSQSQRRVNEIMAEMKQNAEFVQNQPTTSRAIPVLNASTPKKRPHHILMSEESDLTSATSDNDLTVPNGTTNGLTHQFSTTILSAASEQIKSVIDELRDPIKVNFNLTSLLRSTIKLNDSSVVVTKLSEMIYPSNSMQKYSLVNVVGIIKSVTGSYRRFGEIIIADQGVEEFPVRLAYQSVETMKQSPATDSTALYQNNGSENYPMLLSGDIVCIRDLCLAINSINICPHPSQMTVIRLHGKESPACIGQDRSLSKEELKCAIELSCFHVEQLLNPAPKKMLNYKIISLVGQVLAKRLISNTKRAELYLFVTCHDHPSTYLGENGVLIFDQLSNEVGSRKCVYTNPVIQSLSRDNHIISVVLYENHLSLLETMLPMDLVAFYNVHVKDDRFYQGFSQYILHGGNDFGRRCMPVDNGSILGHKVLKVLDAISKKASVNRVVSEYFVNYEANLDESVVSQLGPEIKSLVKQMDEVEVKLQPNIEYCLKKNIIGYVNKEYPLFRPFVNVKSARTIQSFTELPELKDSKLFTITASLVGYSFEDNRGIEIQDMSALRRNFIKIICSSNLCQYVAPFMSVLPKAASCISSLNQEQLKCSKCSSPLLAHLAIPLYLRDKHSQYLCVLISSPEIEQLISCTNNQLIYTDPTSSEICDAFKYTLRTLCPKRLPTSGQFPPRLTGRSFQSYDWTLHSVPGQQPVDLDHYPHIQNSHLFTTNTTIFHVRNIVIHD